MIKPSLFGTLIIMVVYLPILTLTGVEGKMFTPMALTVLMALPARADALAHLRAGGGRALRDRQGRREGEPVHARRAKRVYTPLLDRAIRNRVGVVVDRRRCSSSLAASLATRMGGEFIPSLDEGDVALARDAHSRHQPDAVAATCRRRWKSALKQIPEVKDVFARIGTAEVATDPMPPNISDGYVMLKPRDGMARSARSRRPSWSRRSSTPPTTFPATPTKSPSRSRCASTN